jgi:hypothetical protein
MKLVIDLDMTNTEGTVGVALMTMFVILVSQSSRILNIIFKSKKPQFHSLTRGDESVSDLSEFSKIWEEAKSDEDYEEECLIEDDSVVKKELVSCLDFIKQQKPIELYDYVKKCDNTVAIHGTTKKERHWVYSNLGDKIYAKSVQEKDGKRVLLLTDIGILEGLEGKPSEIVSYDVDNEKPQKSVYHWHGIVPVKI